MDSLKQRKQMEKSALTTKIFLIGLGFVTAFTYGIYAGIIVL